MGIFTVSLDRWRTIPPAEFPVYTIWYFKYTIDILRGTFDDDDEPGEITHFQALARALTGTIGIRNISGVTIAIAVGGSGAIFWMWIPM